MENITANEAFTQEDIDVSTSLHNQLNDIIIAIKDEQLTREEWEGQGNPTSDMHRMEAYSRVAKLILQFSSEINEYIFDLVFNKVDVQVAAGDADEMICPECASDPCACKETAVGTVTEGVANA